MFAAKQQEPRDITQEGRLGRLLWAIKGNARVFKNGGDFLGTEVMSYIQTIIPETANQDIPLDLNAKNALDLKKVDEQVITLFDAVLRLKTHCDNPLDIGRYKNILLELLKLGIKPRELKTIFDTYVANESLFTIFRNAIYDDKHPIDNNSRGVLAIIEAEHFNEEEKISMLDHLFSGIRNQWDPNRVWELSIHQKQSIATQAVKNYEMTLLDYVILLHASGKITEPIAQRILRNLIEKGAEPSIEYLFKYKIEGKPLFEFFQKYAPDPKIKTSMEDELIQTVLKPVGATELEWDEISKLDRDIRFISSNWGQYHEKQEGVFKKYLESYCTVLSAHLVYFIGKDLWLRDDSVTKFGEVWVERNRWNMKEFDQNFKIYQNSIASKMLVSQMLEEVGALVAKMENHMSLEKALSKAERSLELANKNAASLHQNHDNEDVEQSFIANQTSAQLRLDQEVKAREEKLQIAKNNLTKSELEVMQLFRVPNTFNQYHELLASAQDIEEPKKAEYITRVEHIKGRLSTQEKPHDVTIPEWSGISQASKQEMLRDFAEKQNITALFNVISLGVNTSREGKASGAFIQNFKASSNTAMGFLLYMLDGAIKPNIAPSEVYKSSTLARCIVELNGASKNIPESINK